MTAGDERTVRYRVGIGTHSVELDGEILVWDAGTEQLHRLNPSAARIWNELASWRSRAEVANALAADGFEPARVTEDVARCVGELAAAGLLESERAD